MHEWNICAVLVEPREYLQKDLLAEVLFGFSSGEMIPGDLDDRRIKALDEFSCRFFIGIAGARD